MASLATNSLRLVPAILLLIPLAAAFDLGINCGGASSVNASSGAVYYPSNNYTSSTNASEVFQADAFYSGTDLRVVSYGNLSTNANFSGVADVALYATERTGQLIRYDVNVPNGNYSVALIFANVARTLRSSPRIQVQNVIVDQGGVTPTVEPNATVLPSVAEIRTVQASVMTGLLSIVLTAVGASARVSAIRIADNTTTSNSAVALPTSFAINSGGAAIGNYTADAYYYGTSSTILSTARFLVATPQQDARTGPDFGYALNLAPGNYEVDLDFGTGLFNTTGQPIVLIQGVPVPLPTNASSLTTAAYVSNGLLTIGLRGVNGSNATVASVRVAPSGNSRLVAVAAGAPQDVLSGRGIIFSRDQYFTGGTNYSLPGLASNFTLPSYRSAEVTSDLYRNGRTGNFSYSLPVGLPGNYLVDLHFADPVASGPGQRVFNVSAQNVIVAPNVDVFATTGANFTLLVLQVPVNLTQGGNLTLSFAGTSPLPPLLNAIFVHSAPGPIPAIPPAPAPAPAPNLQTPVTSAPSPQIAPAVTPATSAGASAPTSAAPSPAATAAVAGPTSAPATSAFGFLAPSQAGPLPSVATGSIAGVSVLSQSPPAVNNGLFSFAVACGGVNDYVSTFGVTFRADDTPCQNLRDMPPGKPYCRFDDNGANGGFAASTDQTITGTTDPKIFQAERIGTNHYLFVVPAGRYSVNTFFAEISPNDTSIFNVNQPGQRVENIQYLGLQENATLGVDPFKDAGGKFKAAPIRSRTVDCGGPYLEVYFQGTASRDEPKISAIWIYSTDSPL